MLKIETILGLIPIFLWFVLGFCLSLVFYMVNTFTIGFILGFPKEGLGIDLTTHWLAYPYVGLISFELWLVYTFLKVKSKIISNTVAYRVVLALVASFSFWHWFSNITWFKYN